MCYMQQKLVKESVSKSHQLVRPRVRENVEGEGLTSLMDLPGVIIDDSGTLGGWRLAHWGEARHP